jgi:hypothetical protein
MKKDKRKTPIYKAYTCTNKAKDPVTNTPIKTGGELTCSGKVMNEEMTGKCLQQVEYIRGHL